MEQVEDVKVEKESTIDDGLADIKNQIEKRKQELTINKKIDCVDAETMKMLSDKKKEVLNSSEAQNMGTIIATEDVKSNFASEASRINQKNVETAERELDTKTRQRRLDRLNAELDEQHKHNMTMIKRNAIHQQMLDKRKKLVEKYSYLYSNKIEDCSKAYDSEGKEYFVPKDFSFSPTVNKIRQFGRNISKLDKPILQTIKWVLISGVIALGIFILKKFGII